MRPDEDVPGDHRSSQQSPDRPDVSPELLSRSESAANQLITGVRVIDEWYAADFSRRLAELTNLLKNELTKEFNSQLEAELKSQAAAVRTEYEERFYVQSTQWESERQSLKRTIADFQQRVPGSQLFLEINRIESELVRLSAQLRNDAEDDSVSITQVEKLRMQRTELKSYLRGLKSCVPSKNTNDPINSSKGLVETEQKAAEAAPTNVGCELEQAPRRTPELSLERSRVPVCEETPSTQPL